MKINIKTQISPAKLNRLLAKKRPVKIGLTGAIGAGKSLALKFFQKKKIPILQTDLLGHQLLQDSGIQKRLIKVFGRNVLNENGRIDRSQLAKAAFQSARHQKKLNAIMHPAVRQEVTRWIKEQSSSTFIPRLAVVEVPLLFERGFNRFFDGTVSISASRRHRQNRLKKRGWRLAEIRQREKLQWSPEKKDRKADWVIYNQKGEKDLKYSLDQWMSQF